MPDDYESREEAVLRAQLKALRSNAGLTQAEVAELLRKPQSYISKYESGERTLSVLELRAICRAIGADFAVFTADLDAKLEAL